MASLSIDHRMYGIDMGLHSSERRPLKKINLNANLRKIGQLVDKHVKQNKKTLMSHKLLIICPDKILQINIHKLTLLRIC